METPSPSSLEPPAYGATAESARVAELSRLRAERIKAWKDEISPEFKEYYNKTLKHTDNHACS